MSYGKVGSMNARYRFENMCYHSLDDAKPRLGLENKSQHGDRSQCREKMSRHDFDGPHVAMKPHVR